MFQFNGLGIYNTAHGDTFYLRGCGILKFNYFFTDSWKMFLHFDNGSRKEFNFHLLWITQNNCFCHMESERLQLHH
jgi:hypothetical protein